MRIIMLLEKVRAYSGVISRFITRKSCEQCKFYQSWEDYGNFYEDCSLGNLPGTELGVEIIHPKNFRCSKFKEDYYFKNCEYRTQNGKDSYEDQ
tara:strand:+ start:4047 stop:4328 length:282 start_codon:yes stop_codon:yes gene_type:complete